MSTAVIPSVNSFHPECGSIGLLQNTITHLLIYNTLRPERHRKGVAWAVISALQMPRGSATALFLAVSETGVKNL